MDYIYINACALNRPRLALIALDRGSVMGGVGVWPGAVGRPVPSLTKTKNKKNKNKNSGIQYIKLYNITHCIVRPFDPGPLFKVQSPT